MHIHEIGIHRVELPLVGNFRTSVGRELSREALIVEVRTDQGTGWGECGAEPDPSYLGEFNASALIVLRDFLSPLLVGRELHLEDLDQQFAPVRDHQMAKAALASGIEAVAAQTRGVSLATNLGSDRRAVPSGVAIGIHDNLNALLDDVGDHLAQGYQRIKLKVEPEWDLAPLHAVRGHFDEVDLAADANGAYTIDDLPHLAKFDDFGLLFLEQPLDYRDLVDHARLASEIETPICLDESIRSGADARSALALGSCSVVNVKASRVGGLRQALSIARDCRAAGASVWVGGMLETGVGRASQVALAANDLFDLVGDVGATSRYFDVDIAGPPFRLDRDGFLSVPDQVGLGVEVDAEALQRFRRDEVWVRNE